MSTWGVSSSSSTCGYSLRSRTVNQSSALSSLSPLLSGINQLNTFDQLGTSSASQYLEDALAGINTWNSHQATGINTEEGNIEGQQNNPDPLLPNLLMSVFRKRNAVVNNQSEASPNSSSMEEERETDATKTTATSNQTAETSKHKITAGRRNPTPKRRVKTQVNYHPQKRKKPQEKK